TFAGLGQNQEGIGHWRRAEPLVTGNEIFFSRSASGYRCRFCSVGTNVGTALFLGHAHAEYDPRLVFGLDQTTVVAVREDARFPDLGKIRLFAQGGYYGIGHRNRTAMTSFGLISEEHQSGARHMGAVTLASPGQVRQAVL